jgi:hypothetical protein
MNINKPFPPCQGQKYKFGTRKAKCGFYFLFFGFLLRGKSSKPFLVASSGDEEKNITAEHAETAEIFLLKGHSPSKYFEYFLFSAVSAISAVKRYFSLAFPLPNSAFTWGTL